VFNRSKMYNPASYPRIQATVPRSRRNKTGDILPRYLDSDVVS
jgi:hypothetical protein